MITIPISGIIANFEYESESNVTPASLRKSLDDANGEDILVTINSPGGGVFPGLEMFSLLKNYPGNVETRIVSLAASMGSVLALAGDKKTAEDTALYFIHNAQGIGFGDYREMAKESKWLRDISELTANLYEKYTSLTFNEAIDFMDADSHFFGRDLELLGFDIVNTGEKISESQARVNARVKFSEMRSKLQDENYSVGDLEKVAASIDYKKFGIDKTDSRDEKQEIPRIQLNNAQTPAENSAGKNTLEGKHMTLNEFLSQNPAAKIEYENALNERYEAGKNSSIKSMQEKFTAAAKYMRPDSQYGSAVANIACDVLEGKKSVEALETTVAAFDALRESNNSQSAQNEQPGDTPGQQAPPISADGEVNSEADFQAAVARMRKNTGAEV